VSWRPELVPGVDVSRVSGDRRRWAGYSTQYGLTLVTAGAFEFWYRRAVWTQAAGSVKLKEPGEIHRDLRVLAPVTAQTVALAPALVAEAAEGLELSGPPHFRSVVVGRGDEAMPAVARLHAALAATAPDRFACESLVAGALGAVLSAHAEQTPRAAPRVSLRRACEFLRAHLGGDVRLADVADAAGMNRFHLVRCFARELGVPPYEYLTHLRVARARQLLAAGASAAQAAAQVGFCDQSQLHRHFVRRIGVPPGAYARAARGARSIAIRSTTPKLTRGGGGTQAA